MKQILLILAVVALVGGCASTPKVTPNSPKAKAEIKAAIEAAVREAAEKPTGKLTEADREKLTTLLLFGKKLTEVPKDLEKLTQLKDLNLNHNKLTDVKGLEKLTQLKKLSLSSNPDLTKAKIVQLQKALPKCKITYDKSTK
jgi:Leucine-rich repeat (LRR) protein